MGATDLMDPEPAMDLGRRLREVRRAQGLTRTEVARSAGLTWRELAAYERGRADVPESDLWCLAGSCGVDVSVLTGRNGNGNGHRPSFMGDVFIDFFAAPTAEDPFALPLPSRVGDDIAPLPYTPIERYLGDRSKPVNGARAAATTAWRVGGRADARWALADVEAPDDLTIDATVDFTAGDGFGLLFRVTVDDADRITGYSFDVDPVAAGCDYLVRRWEHSRLQWRPLVAVTDPSRRYGCRELRLVLRGDHLVAAVDGASVLSVPELSRSAIELGHEPCRGGGVGVQAWATTQLTVDVFRLAR